MEKGIYDNISKIKKKIPRKYTRYYIYKDSFLRKLFSRKIKYQTKRVLLSKYPFYKSLLNIFKVKKQNYINNLFFKTNKNENNFFPDFDISKNVFDKKIKAFDLLKKNKINYIFCKNKINKYNNTGLNYYILNNFINNDLNVSYLNSLIKDLNDDDNKLLISLKFYDLKNLNEKIIYQNNIYFNYNIYNLCLIEIYKIIILIYINNLIIRK